MREARSSRWRRLPTSAGVWPARSAAASVQRVVVTATLADTIQGMGGATSTEHTVRLGRSRSGHAVLGRSAERREQVWARAEAALEVQPLPGIDEPRMVSGASATHRAAARARREETMRRVRDAGDPERLATATAWLERYRLHHPGVVFLQTRGGCFGVPDKAAEAYNDRAFADLKSFIRDHGSVAPGKKRGTMLSEDTIDGYVGALKETATVLMGCEAAGAGASTIRGRVGKQMRLEQPVLPSDRGLRRALRIPHFAQLAQSSFDRWTHHGATRWGVLRVGPTAFLRPGEVGRVGKHDFAPKRGLHWGHECVRWFGAGEAGWRNPSVYLAVVPIKDASGRAKRTPIPIPALHEEGFSDDPLCPYSALWRLWLRDAAHLTEEQRAVTAIFRHADGSVWSSVDVDHAVHEAVQQLGLPVAEFGGVTLRISGATELRALKGKEGKEILQSYGRWSSDDIGFIYARVTAHEQLEAAAAAIEAGREPAGERPEVEAVFRGWVQPATRH